MDSYHKKLLEDLPSLGSWYHNIDLGEGYFTNKANVGYNPEGRWKFIEPFVPKDLSGKTVLDLGANSGFFSMKMKKRGASHVVCVDPFPIRTKQAEFISKWFDTELEIIQKDATVYCMTTEERFDYVIFLGTFYHLKYPVLVLDRVAEMTKNRMFFQTTMLKSDPSYVPNESYYRGDDDELNSVDFPKMYFIERKYNDDINTWFIVNDAGMTSLLRNARFNIIARPGDEIFVCEPQNTFGKKTFNKLVFPRHGKNEFVMP